MLIFSSALEEFSRGCSGVVGGRHAQQEDRSHHTFRPASPRAAALPWCSKTYPWLVEEELLVAQPKGVIYRRDAIVSW